MPAQIERQQALRTPSGAAVRTLLCRCSIADARPAAHVDRRLAARPHTWRATLEDGTERARTGMQAVAATLPADRGGDRKSNESRLAPAIFIALQHLLRGPQASYAHSRRRGFV
ncbi:hypothetical protein WI73_24525 [Burkholderia ubonensis]|uniref:hypothetical protein n=1 Tax=Burkholderia ubonensis TaxID=101571 RepID=UPI0007531E6A|nr:hypothetical protein [Burkholderia ubonensis]KVC62798.1 hypothetical protein WI73_24525 [Burkholderia ubonensis]